MTVAADLSVMQLDEMVVELVPPESMLPWIERQLGDVDLVGRQKIDRGDPAIRTNDFGGLELYAARVIASDPLNLAQTLQEALPV